MRFLKNKIAKATGLPLSTLSPEAPTQKLLESHTSQRKKPSAQKKIRELESRDNLPSQSSPAFKKHLSGDNIIKNYGRAMTNFALSRMAQPYLESITARLEITSQSFSDYIAKRKKSANCIKKLREMLPIGTDEDEGDLKFKIAFQKICIVFLKFFVANWLYSSKIAEKNIHLKYRFKILRRVKNPQYFTYLKDFHNAFFLN